MTCFEILTCRPSCKVFHLNSTNPSRPYSVIICILVYTVWKKEQEKGCTVKTSKPFLVSPLRTDKYSSRPRLSSVIADPSARIEKKHQKISIYFLKAKLLESKEV